MTDIDEETLRRLQGPRRVKLEEATADDHLLAMRQERMGEQKIVIEHDKQGDED